MLGDGFWTKLWWLMGWNMFLIHSLKLTAKALKIGHVPKFNQSSKHLFFRGKLAVKLRGSIFFMGLVNPQSYEKSGGFKQIRITFLKTKQHPYNPCMVYLPTFGLIFIVNVGKYTSPMDAMEHVFPASNLQHGIFRHFLGVSNPSLMDTLRMKIQRGRYLPGTPLDPGRLVHYLEVQDT